MLLYKLHHPISGNIREQEVFFTGTLEKAARNDQGLVRGWRQRFFQLNTTSLSYFTKPRGDRKGIIRVLGGGVRRMDASETGAFFCCYSVCCVFVWVCFIFWFCTVTISFTTVFITNMLIIIRFYSLRLYHEKYLIHFSLLHFILSS